MTGSAMQMRMCGLGILQNSQIRHCTKISVRLKAYLFLAPDA